MYWEENPSFCPIIQVDLTKRCNLRCKHCSFFRQPYPKESMSDEETLENLTLLRDRHDVQYATWNGGEPTLRKKLLLRGLTLFKKSTIATNGTQPLTEFDGYPKLDFLVSLDGPQEINDQLRGEGVFEKAIRHVKQLRQTPVLVAQTISTLNAPHVERFVEFLHGLETRTQLRYAVAFFVPLKEYRPVESYAHFDQRHLFLPLEERDGVIERLLKLKARYGDFIVNQEIPLRYMHSSVAAQTMRRCPVPRFALCLNPEFNRKNPCVYGEGVDCDKCGCEAAPTFAAFLDGHDVQLGPLEEVMPTTGPGRTEFKDLVRAYFRGQAGPQTSNGDRGGSGFLARAASRVAGSLPAPLLAYAAFDLGLRAAIAARAERLAGRRGRIQFRVRDVPGASWFLSMDGGRPEFRRGEATSPSSVMTISAGVLRDLAAGRTDRMRTVFKGEIQATGTLDCFHVIEAVLGGSGAATPPGRPGTPT